MGLQNDSTDALTAEGFTDVHVTNREVPVAGGNSLRWSEDEARKYVDRVVTDAAIGRIWDPIGSGIRWDLHTA